MGPGNLRPRHRIAQGFSSVLAKSDFGKLAMLASVRRIMRPAGVFSVGWETEMNGR
jgi:hypothetical protein